MAKKPPPPPISRQQAAINRTREAGGKQVSLLLTADIVKRVNSRIALTGDTQTSILLAALARI